MDMFYVPMPFSFSKNDAFHPVTGGSSHDWIDGINIISNVCVEMGGGTGYWCTKCNKLYNKKPSDGYICHNTISTRTLNKEKLFQLIVSLGEIDDVSVRQYVDENVTSPAIEKILYDERQYKTEEEASYGIVYDNLMELIEERYSDGIYDDIITRCDNDTFIYETRTGHVVDEQSSEYLNTWEKLLMTKK